MQFHIFSNPETVSADLKKELNHFLRSHRVVMTQKTLQGVEGVLPWCICNKSLAGALGVTVSPTPWRRFVVWNW